MVKLTASRPFLLLAPLLLAPLTGCGDLDPQERELAEAKAKRIERAASRLAAQREANARQIRAEENARMAFSNGYMSPQRTADGKGDAGSGSAAASHAAPAPAVQDAPAAMPVVDPDAPEI